MPKLTLRRAGKDLATSTSARKRKTAARRLGRIRPARAGRKNKT
jgi:hypothetical protein